MGKSVFISYSHQQGEWVWNSLVPCLRAGGAEVHIDVERMRAGKDVTAQMDAEQNACDLSLLVLSPEFLNSGYCQHEMQRAMARDQFVTILRVDCLLPDELKKKLYVDLRDDKAARQWDVLLQACDLDLGASALDWIKVRDEIVRRLHNNESVNFVVPRKPGFTNPEWRKLIEHVQKDSGLELGIVDLQNPITTSRQALVAEMLKAMGTNVNVPPEPNDLVALGRAFDTRPKPAHLALLHFDMVQQRQQYEVDLFSALRYLMTEKRKLILLIHSRLPFIEFLPTDHPLSSITDLKTVELHGRP